MKQNKNEELQSRRQFFKKAAKSALPILGAIALANMPMIGQASASANGCSKGSCYRGCASVCTGTCQTTCNIYCKSGCKSSCGASCSSTSKK